MVVPEAAARSYLRPSTNHTHPNCPQEDYETSADPLFASQCLFEDSVSTNNTRGVRIPYLPTLITQKILSQQLYKGSKYKQTRRACIHDPYYYEAFLRLGVIGFMQYQANGLTQWSTTEWQVLVWKFV